MWIYKKNQPIQPTRPSRLPSCGPSREAQRLARGLPSTSLKATNQFLAPSCLQPTRRVQLREEHAPSGCRTIPTDPGVEAFLCPSPGCATRAPPPGFGRRTGLLVNWYQLHRASEWGELNVAVCSRGTGGVRNGDTSEFQRAAENQSSLPDRS